MAWDSMPDPILLNIFKECSIEDVLRCGCTCRNWYRVNGDDFLWRFLFYRDYHLSPVPETMGEPASSKPRPSSKPKPKMDLLGLQLSPFAADWKQECRRLKFCTPCIESQEIEDAHDNQILHIAFSHNGKYLSSCAKDGFVKIWSGDTHPIVVKAEQDMKEFSWSYTQFSEFNPSDTLLLVSGVHFGEHTASGEVAIFSIVEEWENDHYEVYLQLQCRALNKPYDIFGCWYTDQYFITGRLHFLAHLVSCSALWLNKASQESDSARKPIVKRILKFYNKSASSVRMVMMAKCFWKGDKADKEEESSTPLPASNNIQSSKQSLPRSGNPPSSMLPAQTGNQRFRSIQTPPSYPIDYTGAQSHNACTMQSPIRYSEDYRVSNRQRVGGDREELANVEEEEGEDEEDEEESQALDDFDDPPLPWNMSLSDEEMDDSAPDTKIGSRAETATPLSNEKNSCPEQANCKEEDSDSETDTAPGERKVKLCHESKLLIFTAGSLTFTPHQIAIKKVKPISFKELIDENKMPTLAQRIAEHKREQEQKEKQKRDGAGSQSGQQPQTSQQAQQGDAEAGSSSGGSGNGQPSSSSQVDGAVPVPPPPPQQAPAPPQPWGSPNWLDENSVAHLFDHPDYIIDFKGHIIGMCLSPDNRYLYVNLRAWPEGAIINDPLQPPPIAQQIDIHVIDLKTMKVVGKTLRSHKAFTSNDECFFIFLDVSEQFVASGAEDNAGYIWDRHHGNALAKFPHQDVVNCVAFNPRDSQMLVTASDDYNLKVWRSKLKMSEFSATSASSENPSLQAW